MNKQQILNKISELTELVNNLETSKLQLEEHNFHINSDGWIKQSQKNEDKVINYLINPEKDITEYLDDDFGLKGEQLFTWDAMNRETEKAGKRIPTDEEWTELLKDEEQLKLIEQAPVAGHRSTNSSFYNHGAHIDLWSSSESGSKAWDRNLGTSNATVYRDAYDKAYGFSVRCLKD